MRRLLLIIFLMLNFVSAFSQFLLPVFEEPILVKDLSNDAEETTPIVFNNGNSIFYHRTYIKEDEEGTEVRGKDIWFSQVDEKAGKKLNDTIPYKKVWERPYRLFRDGEVEGINAIIGSSTDGQRIYLLNTTFTEDTFSRRVVYLDRKGKNGWEKEYQEINVPGLMFDGRNIDLHMNSKEDVLLVSMAPKIRSLNEDLYVSLKQEDGSWSPIINLGPDINTNRYEVSPFLSTDKKTLYFTSNGYDGYGDGDVFLSHRMDESWQKWTRPLNLGEPINSKDFDAFFMISDSTDAYFISDRASAYSDIYYARATGEYKMANVDSVGGQFFFKQLPVADSKLEVYDSKGNLIMIIETDENGKFGFVKLAVDDDYSFQLSADDNSELVGGKIYLTDQKGNLKGRLILSEDGTFKKDGEIKETEEIQGKYLVNEEPRGQAKLIMEDENSFIIDTIYTDSSGRFTYDKLIYDRVFLMFPLGLSEKELNNADLFLTDKSGNRTRTFELEGKETGKGRILKENLAVANSIIKVFDKKGNLVEVIVTKEDGSFSYKKLSPSDDMVFVLDANDVGDLVGGIVYLLDADNNRTRFFIQEGNQLIPPSAFGKETVYGAFNYNKLPMVNTALEVLDQNGMPIDTIYTDENGLFEYEHMRLDENYSIRPLASKEDSEKLDIYLTDVKGNKMQSAETNNKGTFAFISVMNDGESLIEKELPENKQISTGLIIYFDYNQVSLSIKAKSALRKSITSLKRSTNIELIGHTDDKGSNAVNQLIGQQRAESVKAYLVSQGINASKIETTSAGESKPVVSNDTEGGRAKNRRVVIKN